MQVTLSRVSPVEVSLRVALPKDRVNTALNRAYSELSKTAQLRGFRKGKVPMPILRQYYGAQVSSDVLRKLIDETLPGALRDNNVDPIAQPRLEAADDFNGATDWSYTAVMEVRPEVTEVDTSTLQLTRTLYPVADADVEKALQAKREENATLRTPEPARAARQGDTVTIDMMVSLDGVERPEFATRGRPVEVGTGRLLKDIDDAIVGMNVGETRELKVTFPEGHRQVELAGRTADAKVSVTAMQEKVLPELDDEFAKDVGKESLAELTASLRAELEAAAKERSEGELREAAVEALVAANQIPVPPTMVAQQIEMMKQEFTRGLQMKGALPDTFGEVFRPEAEKRMRAGLLLAEFARIHGLRVTEEDINAHIEQIARETGKAVQRLRVEYRDARKREQIVAAVLEEKVLVLLLSKATITEKNWEPAAEAEAPAAPVEGA